MSEPLLPYAGTSGHSGGATSEERARRDDSDGTTADRQARTVRLLDLFHVVRSGDVGKQHGLTWKDLGILTGWHHGQSSGVLSVLHKEGRIARLTERREKCFVYVLPEYIEGRETQQHGRKRKVLTEVEQKHVDGARQVIDLHGSGEASMRHNVVPTWRVKALLDIIDRLT